MSVINKIKIKDVEYDVQDKQTLEYVNEQLNDIYKKEETDAKITEAISDKATTEYVDQAVGNIDLSNYYNKEETENKIDEAFDNVETFENYGIYKVKINDNLSVNTRSAINNTTEGGSKLLAKINEIINNEETEKKFPFIILVEYENTILTFKPIGKNYNNPHFLSDTITISKINMSYIADEPLRFEMNVHTKDGTQITSLLLSNYDGFDITAINNKYYKVERDYQPAHKKYVDDSINTAMANIDLSNYYTKEETNEVVNNIDLSQYYTKEEIDTTLGDIDTILTQIVDSTLDAESKEY